MNQNPKLNLNTDLRRVKREREEKRKRSKERQILSTLKELLKRKFLSFLPSGEIWYLKVLTSVSRWKWKLRKK
ncbi:hypothetical protein D3C81_2068810 [compost metagenome]